MEQGFGSIDQQAMSLFELTEHVRFFGQLVGTPGLSEENNAKANDNIKLLLDAMEQPLKEKVGKLTAKANANLIV